MIPEFPHKAPKGYYYEQVQFKRDVIAVWIHHTRKFDYNLGSSVACIWGFYNTKTKTYHAPINSTKCGDKVNIKDTTPYSAMIPKFNPLEAAFI
jgi:hypothetical protein